MKQGLLLCFYILGSIVVGAMFAGICEEIPMLKWLAYSHSIGISKGNPLVLDLSVLKITFAFSMGISVAQIVTIAGALFLYNRSSFR